MSLLHFFSCCGKIDVLEVDANDAQVEFANLIFSRKACR